MPGPLSHPNIVRVHRVEAQPQPFIDMELVEGPTLGVWLADHGGRMPWQEAVRIACHLASALEHAHRLGRVHRDVKPGNILMADEGRTPKLVDFGIAMIDRPEATRLTRHGEMVGTPALHVAGTGARRAGRMRGPISTRWARYSTRCWSGCRRSRATALWRSPRGS